MAMIKGTKRADILTGTAKADTIYGYAGDDQIRGNGGDDTIIGGGGVDSIWGGEGNDLIRGDHGDATPAESLGDYLYGDGGNDDLGGGLGDDHIEGGTGNDKLWGDHGDDTLIGGEGADWLRGFYGEDTLTGDEGADTFDFFNITASTERASSDPLVSYGVDTITDFEPNIDKIDLLGVDANETNAQGTNDAFMFIGNEEFSGQAGELRYHFDGEKTIIEGDVDGDAKADLVIYLTGMTTPEVVLTSNDFIL